MLGVSRREEEEEVEEEEVEEEEVEEEEVEEEEVEEEEVCPAWVWSEDSLVVVPSCSIDVFVSRASRTSLSVDCPRILLMCGPVFVAADMCLERDFIPLS
jgi:hypothetical protein